MKLPVDLNNTFYRYGGRITRISSIAHRTEEPKNGYSRDVWFFIGNVLWHDSSVSRDFEIAPCFISANGDDHTEILALSEVMSQYLLEHGEWYLSGDHKGWYAHR